MNAILETNLSNPEQLSASLEEQFSTLGEIPVSDIALILGVKTMVAANYLKAIGMRGNFGEKLKGTVRYIELTQKGVGNLLDLHDKKISAKKTIVKDAPSNISPDILEEDGILFPEFKKLLYLRNKQANPRTVWRYLTQSHVYLFGDASKRGTNSLYLLKNSNIQKALEIADTYSRELALEIRNIISHSTRKSSNTKNEGFSVEI